MTEVDKNTCFLVSRLRHFSVERPGTALLALFLVAGWAASGCDLLPASSSGGSGTVQMAFEAVTSSSGTSTAGKQLETNEFVIEGTNGTLTISRLALLVGEFELEIEEGFAETEIE